MLELYHSVDDLSIQSNCLRVLLQRHGGSHLVDGVKVDLLLEKIRISATQSAYPDWFVLTFIYMLLFLLFVVILGLSFVGQLLDCVQR